MDSIFTEEEFSMAGYDKHIRNAKESQHLMEAYGKRK
jgi:hypothetical protein